MPEPRRRGSLLVVAATSSAVDTAAVGAAVSELCRPSDLLLLTGDLGAGKTVFCQGFGRGLGVDQRITSPTFTLVHTYRGRLEMHHLDVYRLEQIDEIADLGLGELLDRGSVTVIEWGDTIAPALPQDYLEVRIALGDGDDDRRLEFEPVGSGWSARMKALEVALEAWSGGEG